MFKNDLVGIPFIIMIIMFGPMVLVYTVINYILSNVAGEWCAAEINKACNNTDQRIKDNTI